MKIESINPWTGEVVAEWPADGPRTIEEALEKSRKAFRHWREEPLSRRAERMERAAEILLNRKEEFASMITREMGKPIAESRAEVEKCAWVCRFYAEKGEEFLADKPIQTDASESFVRYEPLGTIFAIMPWNFPFWQVFRFAAPNLVAGNAAVLKHASNVSGCAQQIEGIFREADFPEELFINLRVGHDRVEEIIANPTIRGVTLTGSERAGRSVGSLAGRYLKKSVLELGGNNAFIVCEDADLEAAVEVGVKARMINSGQSCIASKRFILVDTIADEFTRRFLEAVRALRTGDPMEEETEIGPLAREDLAEELHRQVKESVEQGAEILAGGRRERAFYEPTVLDGVVPGMSAFEEETFGPVAALIRARDEEEAYRLAARSRFGLGVTVFTTDIERARRNIPMVEDGSFFVNELVKSDPRLPFGGTRNSGYGRELARDGMLEFVNRKTVYLMRPGEETDRSAPVE